MFVLLIQLDTLRFPIFTQSKCTSFYKLTLNCLKTSKSYINSVCGCVCVCMRVDSAILVDEIRIVRCLLRRPLKGKTWMNRLAWVRAHAIVWMFVRVQQYTNNSNSNCKFVFLVSLSPSQHCFNRKRLISVAGEENRVYWLTVRIQSDRFPVHSFAYVGFYLTRFQQNSRWRRLRTHTHTRTSFSPRSVCSPTVFLFHKDNTLRLERDFSRCTAIINYFLLLFFWIYTENLRFCTA